MDNPTSEHKKKIIAAAEKWPPYISLNFEFVESRLYRASSVGTVTRHEIVHISNLPAQAQQLASFIQSDFPGTTSNPRSYI